MLKILHLESDPDFKKRIADLVGLCEHKLFGVDNVEDALTRLARGGVDLVICGISCDGGGAETLLRTLATREELDVPVIVVTKEDSLEQRERLFSLGVVDYMISDELSEERLSRYFDALVTDDELTRFMRTLDIAVIDDSSVILKITAHILSLYGINTVTLFSDPLALLEDTRNFDVYITDIVLPNMSGDKLVSELRARQSDAIIITMSKFTGEKPLSNVLLAGADDYIHKPFDAAGLISRLKVNVRSYQYKKSLERMAVSDGLTGLYNHRYSYERLEEEVSKAERYSRPLSLLMIDIDDFKAINDTHGHRTGDEVLVSVSHAFKETLRSVDVVGRYGGEEFIVILPETSLYAASIAAEKIRATIESIPCGKRATRVSVSVGVAEHQDGEAATALVNRADSLLYEAKRAGKNRVICQGHSQAPGMAP